MKKIVQFTVLSLTIVISQFGYSASKQKCPETVADVEEGVATASFIKKCLGKPIHIDKNNDGRFVYLYKFKNGDTVAFLFGKDKKVIRKSIYSSKL